jgi:protein-tyrosine phosphatase
MPVSRITVREADEVGDAIITLSFCPGRKAQEVNRNVDNDIEELRNCGVTTVVTLVEQEELDKMGLNKYFDKLNDAGMKSIHYPIKDHLIPFNIATYNELINNLTKLIKDGEKYIFIAMAVEEELLLLLIYY